jgi:hypothetical protein
MNETLEKIHREVLQMTRQEQLELASMLIAVDEPEVSDSVRREWEDEISSRVLAVEEGRVNGIPYDVIL